MTEDFIQNVQFDLFSVNLVIEDTATLSLAENFIQNIQFDLFSVELVIGETATLLLAENYVTIREVFVDGVKVEPNESKQIFLTSNTSHKYLENKNAEPEFQHVTQAEKTGFVTASDFVEALIENATGILYADLLALINNNELIPNSSYRLTNYITTTAQADTTSAGHDFDIIVTALSTNELSENAKCVSKVGDTYFENANLEAWEIKYCIDNDTSRFAWADTVNGKGVIYYMKDEWNNECPYDFKNIQFKKSEVFLYTFGGTTDDSLTGGCHHNTMMEYTLNSVLTLNFNTFGTGCHSNTFDNECHSNTFGTGCYSNTFSIKCDSNTFGNNCYYNTFGNGFDSNVFGNDCYSNVFGDKCDSNTFGNNCTNNTFNDKCYSNTFGDICSSNTFGSSCYSNTFGDICSSNTFGDGCQSNTFGSSCSSNTFGNSCYYNNFYAGNAVDAGTTKKDFIKYIVLEDGCRHNNFYSTLTTSSTNYLQRIRIKGLQNTSATNIPITLSETNTKYEWIIYYTSSGVLKQHSLDYISSHIDLTNKNSETAFQHIDTTTTKETLVNDDKVPIYDSVTGKVVLTDKTNVGYRITDIISITGVWSSSKTNEEINKLLPLIYAGL